MIAEKEAVLLKEQELYNRLREKDYGPAIALALELKRPHRLWSVLRDAMTDGMGEVGGDTGERRGGGRVSTHYRVFFRARKWNVGLIIQNGIVVVPGASFCLLKGGVRCR